MSFAKPPELYTAPELAILAVLDQTLQQTIYALFAAHPELVDDIPFHLRGNLSPEIWVADAIYNQANALQQAIERYREAVERTNRIPSLGEPRIKNAL